uniref:Uncharacterized protein n=1 Tax=Melopsittacus undulatus TaxID=13146 RepID=A0A8V5GPP4_MELUD
RGYGCSLLVCLRSLSTGVWAQVRLEETGGGLRAPGDSVLLSCRGYGFRFAIAGVRWYRQAPGGRVDRNVRSRKSRVKIKSTLSSCTLPSSHF